MRKRRKGARRTLTSGWRAARRCVVFFTAVCIIPVMLVLLVATDRIVRVPSRRDTNFVVHQYQLSRKEQSFYTEQLLDQNMTAIAKRLEARKKHLKNTCRLLGLDRRGNDTLHRPNPWEFLVNDKHHLVWCNVFKAASTSWMYNFNILAGYTAKFLKKTKSVPMTLARKKYPRPSLPALRKAFNESVSFLIVRHPFERLLSAYRDKIQHALPHTLHQKLGKEIIMKYRYKMKDLKSDEKSLKWPSFSEFVAYLVDSVRNGEHLDMHWTPITEFCTPCMFDFQIIAHTETLQEDQSFLIKVAHLENIIEPQWKNSGKGMTSDQVKKYYSQLTRSQILQLYHIYRYDFELFNYSVQGYLELGRPDKDPSSLLAAITMKDFRQNELPKVY